MQARLIILAILGFILYGIWQIPPDQMSREVIAFYHLPIADFNMLVADYWKGGQRGHALALIDYQLDNHLGEAEGLRKLRAEYLGTIAGEKTPWSELLLFGQDVPISGLARLKGASLGDVMQYSELREQIHKSTRDDGDEAIKVVNSLSPALVHWGPGESLFAILKGAHKNRPLNPALVKNLRILLDQYKAKKSAKQLVDPLSEIWDLARYCTSFSQFSLFLASSEDFLQVKFFAHLLKNYPNAGRFFEPVLIMFEKSPEQGRKVLDFLNAGGIDALGKLYLAVEKGSRGIEFVMANPAMGLKLMKSNQGAGSGLFEQFTLGFISLREQFGGGLEFIRYLVMALIFATLPLMFPIDLLVNTLPATMSLQNRDTIYKFYIPVGVMMLAGAMFVLKPHGPSAERDGILPILASTPVAPIAAPSMNTVPPAAIGENPIPTSSGRITVISGFWLLFAILLQGYAFNRARGELDEIMSSSLSIKTQLRNLENIDIFFDLPLYLGLLCSVVSFILITFDPNSSRLLAYSATVFGIVVSSVLRVYYLFPFRKRLITQDSSPDEEEFSPQPQH